MADHVGYVEIRCDLDELCRAQAEVVGLALLVPVPVGAFGLRPSC
ncbi:hypothetical protein [Nocardia seriolae]|nr:hypothetical protein [Nocardia seriolae]